MIELQLIRLGADPYYLELTRTDFHLGSDNVYIQGENSKIGLKAPQINAEGTIKLYNQDSAITLDEDSVEINATQVLINGVSLSATVAQEVQENDPTASSSVAVMNHLESYSLKTDLPTVESEITTEETKKENAVNSKAVIAYAASALTPYSTTSETMEYLDENYAKIDDLPDWGDYAMKNAIPDVLTTLGQILPEDEVQPVSSVAVINYVSAQDFATVSQIPQTPTIEFKTGFILTPWNDLSTCWTLLNVCHIEINMIGWGFLAVSGNPIGRLKPGMPVPSEEVSAQLAGLNDILTLQLKPDGHINLSEFIGVETQINVSIFYTFTEYKT
jgi:hypothetical protein